MIYLSGSIQPEVLRENQGSEPPLNMQVQAAGASGPRGDEPQTLTSCKPASLFLCSDANPIIRGCQQGG